MGEGCGEWALCVCLHFSEEILRILQVWPLNFLTKFFLDVKNITKYDGNTIYIFSDLRNGKLVL